MRGKPEIRFADIFVVFQGIGRAAKDYLAVLHHVAEMGDAQSRTGVLLHEENRRPLLGVDPLDDAIDILHQEGRKTEGRLVEEHEPGPGHECTPYDEHLLFPARQIAAHAAAEVPDLGDVVEDHF